jgi:uncharacterized membrane protein (DUF2068 family)
MRLSSAVRAIALVEAAKGTLVILVGLGLLSLIHHDVQRFAERLVAHAHLNPAARYPRVFIDVATQLTDGRLWLLAAGGAVYASVRFIEAYGLWLERRWAEWLAALSGGVYIPFELFELHEQFTWLSLGALLLNAAIVAIMAYSVFQANRHRPADAI